VCSLSTEYELNTTCSLQVLDDLDSSQVAPHCRSTITCIFILYFEALSSRSSIVRGQLDYVRLSRFAQRRTNVDTSHTEFTHSETYRQFLMGQRCIYQNALFLLCIQPFLYSTFPIYDLGSSKCQSVSLTHRIWECVPDLQRLAFNLSQGG
jgi:hypothetical protein